jgi:hypothetical protein
VSNFPRHQGTLAKQSESRAASMCRDENRQVRDENDRVDICFRV